MNPAHVNKRARARLGPRSAGILMTREEFAERNEYLGASVREYWIIDRCRRVVTVHRESAGNGVTAVIKENDSYQSVLLPGFVLPVGRLLATADKWSKKSSRRQPPKEPQSD